MIAAAGPDMFASALTPADAKRLMRFVPEVLNKSSYDKNECAARMKLSQESVPGSAARETQARCEAVLRKIMNESVLRSVEKGTMRVDAATVQSVLRPYQYNMSSPLCCHPRASSATRRERAFSTPMHKTRPTWSRRPRTTRSCRTLPKHRQGRTGSQGGVCQAQSRAQGGARRRPRDPGGATALPVPSWSVTRPLCAQRNPVCMIAASLCF